jgi:hypothetical protein
MEVSLPSAEHCYALQTLHCTRMVYAFIVDFHLKVDYSFEFWGSKAVGILSKKRPTS